VLRLILRVNGNLELAIIKNGRKIILMIKTGIIFLSLAIGNLRDITIMMVLAGTGKLSRLRLI